MTYQAIVTRLTNVRPHPNADRLSLATVQGYQIVVGIDAVEGQLGIFFPEDGRVSTDFCLANDLYPRLDPTTNERVGGGFFDPKNNRVRSQAFRGEKSTGYFASLDSVAYTGVNLSELYEGYQFDTLNDQIICEKYYTPKTLAAMRGGTARTRKENIMFPKHVDTKKFQYDADKELTPGSVIYITEKLHGTSQRTGYVLESNLNPRKWHHKLFRRDPGETMEWTFMVGTRNVVLTDPQTTQGFYSDESFRFKAAEPFRGNLHKGEVVYYELVGYTSSDGLIMGEQDSSVIKELKNKYGPKMQYTYGALPGEALVFVYRITQLNEDGNIVELSWPQVKARCNELGVKYVPQFEGPIAVNDDGYGEHDLYGVKDIVAYLTDGVSSLDNRHIREGVVVRIENQRGQTVFLKSKSWNFGVLEGYLKNDENYVDTEEVS